MAWIVKGRDVLGRTVSKRETKACTLCGALNFFRNRECRTCGWGGVFEQDSAAVDYHWQTLTERHEEVRLEHVVPSRLRGLGDFGRPRKMSAWQCLVAACVQQWEALASRREARRAAREMAPRPKSALPPA